MNFEQVRKVKNSIQKPSIYAIDDVHGEINSLRLIHEQPNSQLSTSTYSVRALVIHLGHLINCGQDSILCLYAALNWSQGGCKNIVLPSNHEQRLMSFWDSVQNSGGQHGRQHDNVPDQSRRDQISFGFKKTDLIGAHTILPYAEIQPTIPSST